MTDKVQLITKKYLKNNLPDLRAGMIVKVYEIIKEDKKESTKPFQGIIIAIKHGRGIQATFTVRGKVAGQYVEKIYPLHSPNIQKIEVLAESRTRRAKLYFLRDWPEAKIRKRLKPTKTKS